MKERERGGEGGREKEKGRREGEERQREKKGREREKRVAETTSNLRNANGSSICRPYEEL